MLKRARYFRWGILFASILVEFLAFWIGGPQIAPAQSFSEALFVKLQHPESWAWAGWASLSMAWLWAELSMIFYSNGQRTRALMRRSAHETMIFDTGVHWLVLLREIRLNRLNDGQKESLEESLFARGAKRSFAWHAIWWPILLAAITFLYFVGWVAWSLRNVTHAAQQWSLDIHEKVGALLIGPFEGVATILANILGAIPFLLEQFHLFAREESFITLGVIAAIWFFLRVLIRLFDKMPLAGGFFHVIARLTLVIGVFAIIATPLFDWLSFVYSAIPHHGVMAVGFIPLTLASAFYFPHLLFWSSWRYAIIRDTETLDATLLTLGGVFNSLQQRINLQRIVDTDIYQHWWQRVFDVGDIALKEMGGGEAEVIRHIAGPHRLLDEIRSAIREGKKRSGQRSEFDDPAPLDNAN